MKKKTYTPSEFAALIGVSVRTLQRWDKTQRLVAYRTPSGRRYYKYQQYLNYRKKMKHFEQAYTRQEDFTQVDVGVDQQSSPLQNPTQFGINSTNCSNPLG
jgi:putative resolvase